MMHMRRLELKIVDGEAVARARQRRRRGLTADETADEEALDDAARYFMQSYRGMRFTIGVVAFALPWLLITIDWWLITSEPQIRGSLSAYYHSSARDVFVGGLIATGGFMISYMAGKRGTYDYWLSSIAGVLVMIVALVPTGRKLDAPNFKVANDSCAAFPGPPYCNGTQSQFGEDTARLIHQLCASTFVVLLAALCIVFALREFGYGPSAAQLCGRERNVKAVREAVKARNVSLWTYLWKGVPAPAEAAHPAPRRRTLLYISMTLLILASVAWALLGVAVPVPGTTYKLGPTYVTEFVSFNAFGIAWMASSKDLNMFRRIGDLARNLTSRAVRAGQPQSRAEGRSEARPEQC